MLWIFNKALWERSRYDINYQENDEGKFSFNWLSPIVKTLKLKEEGWCERRGKNNGRLWNLCIALNNKKAPPLRPLYTGCPKHSQMETKKLAKLLKYDWHFLGPSSAQNQRQNNLSITLQGGTPPAFFKAIGDEYFFSHSLTFERPDLAASKYRPCSQSNTMKVLPIYVLWWIY